jgi:N-acetylglutamate synthase
MTSTFTTDHVLAMELAAARAWPAKYIIDVDGWRVRLSGGGTRRANSVLPLRYTGDDLSASIASVEGQYRAQKTRAYFQVMSIAQPSRLDAELEQRGYAFEEPCLLMAKPIAPTPMPAGVIVSDAPSDAWLSVYAESLDPARKAAAPSVLAVVPKPHAYLLVMRDGVPLSSALAVVSPDGFTLVECVATRSAVRRSGGGQIVMDALESWSAANGAHTSVLQVVAGNTAARRLYEGRGYREAGHYHYRWRDVV